MAGFICLLLLLVGGTHTKFSKKTKAQLESEAAIEELCQYRDPMDYFRLPDEVDCRVVVSCDREEPTGSLRLATLKCPQGLFFDMERQTCDWRDNVQNCDMISRPVRAKPNLVTDRPVCPEGSLQCGSGECLPRKLYCDNIPHCKDSSDEHVCTVSEDPNRAPVCNPAQCKLPGCFCSSDGTKHPQDETGNLDITEVPMMITFSFNGAVNEETKHQVYDRLFHPKRLNPNGCTAKATFFVSHKYTDYAVVDTLHKHGHEIGVFSITHREDPDYWTKGDYDTWRKEMSGARLIIETLANITDGSVIGVRAPYLRVGGNQQFSMMDDEFFAYDASMVAPLSRVPIWPYTLTYRMPHKCIGNAVCPSRSHPVWEMPINELDRGEHGDQMKLTGCHHVSSCTSVYEKEQLVELLQRNFDRHYKTNKAPLSLSFNPSWLMAQEGFVDAVDEWISDILKNHRDVFFVQGREVIEWMQKPTSVRSLHDFPQWKKSCTVRDFSPSCNFPNNCILTSRELSGESIMLRTCLDCPDTYPWIDNLTGEADFWTRSSSTPTSEESDLSV